MTQEPKPPERDAQEARERIEELKSSFKELRKLMKAAIAKTEADASLDAKPLKSKLNELQSAHLTILQAEEAFYAKFVRDNVAVADAVDAIRDQIGRALDRIRAAERAGGVSGGSE